MAKKLKLYTDLTVAQTVATKKSEGGVVHNVHAVDGGHIVATEGEYIAYLEAKTAPQGTKAQTTETDTAQTDTTVVVATATKSAEKAKLDEVIQVAVPGKITSKYVITPVLGSRPRWFEIARLSSAPVMVGDKVQFSATRKVFASRKLDPQAYAA